MPRQNGRGPMGRGPRTGRGVGNCLTPPVKVPTPRKEEVKK